MKDVELFYQPEGRLRMLEGDKCHTEVRLAWASPLSYPDRYLAFLDGKGREIFMVVEPEKELPSEVYELAKIELRRRYLNGVVQKIVSLRTEFGSTYWKVITDRGEAEFLTQSLQENAQWLTPTYLMLVDVDGNRYEITDTEALDERSRAMLAVTV